MVVVARNMAPIVARGWVLLNKLCTTLEGKLLTYLAKVASTF